ncbi:hypothetical protein MLD38_006864 [Melastoma candidum]|uniref:Uncharacterized protein n=1 Tax=Melastoma candidum TaxID=119954 RepID=A0ACB9RQI2_9MYRT|nr:hypothetical protein MLD38_006864 [Melastoma candidum]
METIFLSQDLWKLVKEGYEEVPEGISLSEGDNTSVEYVINPTEDEQKAYKENVMKNALALRILQQSMSKTIYPRIYGLKKTKYNEDGSVQKHKSRIVAKGYSQKPISWSSKKQSTVALSSAEAEYITANEATREVVWLRRLLLELQQKVDEPTTIVCDNQSAIVMTKNLVFHARSKHIELRHRFTREMVSQKEILLEFISTHDQPADVLTKAVSSQKFETFKDFLKIIN